MLKLSSILLAFWCCTVCSKTVALYSLKDLEILETEKNYQEFFQHALDLRPSLRTKVWYNLVDSMAITFSSQLLKKKLIDDKDFALISEILAYPGQKSNLEFKRNRGQLALIYFKEKAKVSAEDTRVKILKFWQEDNDDIELGLKLAGLYEKNTENDVGSGDYDKQIWSFYEQAAKIEVADFYCKRSQMQEAIVHYLNFKFNDAHLNLKTLIPTVMHTSCWKVIKPNLKNILFTAPADFAMNLYQLLKLENELTTEDKEYFSFIYVINGPINGDTFNEAWNIVGELKNHSKKRQDLLDRLKAQGHLPDGILGSFDETRKRVITSYIQKHVPEYFDFYTRECLTFLKGEKAFPQGNPTLHCRELIELNQKEQTGLVDPHLILQYQKAAKI